ncbi:MAG: MFS transporter, partial [Cyclobacteriaceae bacterium]
HSFVSSVNGFFAARAALGLGESGNFPSAVKATATWFPQRERAFATTLFNAGTNVGPILAPAIVPWIALTYGWQMAFIVAGVAGLLWLLLWIPFYTQPEKNKHVTQEELNFIQSDRPDVSTGPKSSWAGLLKYRQTWAFILAKFITDPVWWFFLIWLPDYFKKTRGLDIKESWVHLVSIYTIITLLSLIGGWLPGYLTKKGWSVTRARKTTFFVFACCFLPIFFVTRVEDWPAVFLIGLAGAAHQAWSANLFTSVSDMFPKYAIGSVVGIGGMAGAVGGMLFPVFSGRLLDIFTARGNVTGGYTVLFTICAFAYLVAFVIHHLLAPRFEKFELK